MYQPPPQLKATVTTHDVELAMMLSNFVATRLKLGQEPENAAYRHLLKPGRYCPLALAIVRCNWDIHLASVNLKNIANLWLGHMNSSNNFQVHVHQYQLSENAKPIMSAYDRVNGQYFANSESTLPELITLTLIENDS